MSKYIIKNCPAFVQSSYKNRDWAIENACELIDDKCCLKQNCVLKQIVELAKGHTELCKNCEQQIKECDCGDICNAYRLDKILKLLDIQECE
jgi:hypothetical protein